MADEMGDVIQQYGSGKISKEEYWAALLEFHRALECYKKLIKPNHKKKTIYPRGGEWKPI